MKINDILAPWEYDQNNPPRIISAVESRFDWRGEERAAVVAVLQIEKLRYAVIRFEGDGSWWMCDANDDDYALAFTGSSICPKKNYPRSHSESYDPAPDILCRRATKCLAEELLCRVLLMEGDAEFPWFTTLISMDGTSRVASQSRVAFETADFVPLLWLKESIKNFQSDELRLLLLREAELRTTNWSFATRFASLPFYKRDSMVYEAYGNQTWDKGWKEYEALLDLLATTDSGCWKNYAEGFLSISFSFDENSSIPDVGFVHSAPRLCFWAQSILDYGPLRLKSGTLEQPCVREWLADSWPPSLYTEPPSKPSARKQIKARLQLLEWAKEFLPPDLYNRAVELDEEMSKK